MRKSTVMALDVVGFSKMMGSNPETTVETLSARRKILYDIIDRHKGKVFNEAGDSIVSEFTESEAAALCAVEIQTDMARLNLGSSADRRMIFRIGIHFGDVMDVDGNVFGDTVNVAARLEAASSPEGVHISKCAHQNLSLNTQQKFEFVGPIALKNIANEIEVFLWSIGHQAGRYGSSDTEKVFATQIIPGSLAVLELKNLSSDKEQQYFCEGVSEDLINALSRYKSLRVTSSNASFSFSAGKHSLKEIGAALSVRYILSGNVRSTPSRIRITIKLDNAGTNQTIWSEKFEASKNDLWELEETLASSVAFQIVGQVETDEIRSAAKKPPQDAKAYDLVLQGLKHHRSSVTSYDDAKKAYSFFSKAHELEPDYPRAIAWKVCSMANYQNWEPSAFSDNWLNEAVQLIERALEIDPDDAEANRIMGSMQRAKGNFDLSITHHKHAAELCPSDLYISSKLCEVLMYDGRLEEAENELNRAKEINPTGSDQLLQIEGTLKFWQEDFAVCKAFLSEIRIPSPMTLLFLAAAEFYIGNKKAAKKIVAKIENDYCITIQRLFSGESYRLDDMKAKFAPLFP